MRADNEGEGGIMALIALDPAGVALAAPLRRKAALVALGIFGASLFYGDGMITPAISVLSAVEGLEVVAPVAGDARRADHARRSSPCCSRSSASAPARSAARSGRSWALWFALLAVAGLREVVAAPRDPARALAAPTGSASSFEHGQRRVHRARLGRADRHRRRGALRGHGPLRPPPDPARVVRRRLPGADPQLHGPGRADPRRRRAAIDNPFFLLFPHWARIPMVVARHRRRRSSPRRR